MTLVTTTLEKISDGTITADKITFGGTYYNGGLVSGTPPTIMTTEYTVPKPLFDHCDWQSYFLVGLDALFADVQTFHRAFGHPAPRVPTMLSKERAKSRSKWTKEECTELEDAETLVDQVDAAIDQIYFAVGTLVELGVKPQPFWRIVQGANMAKLDPVTGKPLYHPDGKTRKPEGWEPPEPKLLAELERQIAEAELCYPC